MNPPDRRTKAEILQHPRWDPLIGDPKINSATVDNLRILDDFLRYIEELQIADTCALTANDFLTYDHKNRSPSRLMRLMRGMEALFPGHPAILPLREAIRQKERACSAPIAMQRAKPRKLSKSVPYAQLPEAWRAAFDDMEAGFDRNGELPPTAGMMPTLKMKARQLIRSARNVGLKDELSVETVRAYARDLRARGLATATLRASFSALLKFARYIGADAHTVQLLSDLAHIYEAEAQKAPKQKFKHLQNTGYSTVALTKKAEHLLSDANTLPCPRRRHAQRNRAAAIALFSVLPVRLADTRLKFGETLLWTGESYLIDTRLSKNSYPWSAKIDLRLNKFIDALILRDCAPEWLDQMRQDCLSTRRALFVKSDGTPVAYDYVSDAWRREIGTGEHIARTVLHTFLGVELGPAGTDMAMAACGQVSQKTSNAYQDNALAMAQRMKGQQELTKIANPEFEKLFKFI